MMAAAQAHMDAAAKRATSFSTGVLRQHYDPDKRSLSIALGGIKARNQGTRQMLLGIDEEIMGLDAEPEPLTYTRVYDD